MSGLQWFLLGTATGAAGPAWWLSRRYDINVLAALRPDPLCGDAGACIVPRPDGEIPRCGKPAGHVERGDRWHTPDDDDWGDLRWSDRR